MKVINFPSQEGYSDSKKVIALGKFDLIHNGHKKLLEKTVEVAKQNNFESVVMMFKYDENKKTVFTFEERVSLMRNFDIDYSMSFEPKAENFAFTKEQFIQFLKDINIVSVIVGKDFRFGKDREGSVEDLINNFDVEIIKTEHNPFGDKISSSEITSELSLGNMSKFKDEVGFYYFYSGEVVHGDSRGKDLGFPTANIEFSKTKVSPSNGIYLSYVIYDGMRRPSLTSISTNPTFTDSDVVKFETYILDFDSDIYGEYIYVELIDKIRDPIKFTTVEDLVERMNEDKKVAKNYFNL